MMSNEFRTFGFWFSMVLIGLGSLMIAGAIYPRVFTAMVIIFVGIVFVVIGVAVVYILAAKTDSYLEKELFDFVDFAEKSKTEEVL